MKINKPVVLATFVLTLSLPIRRSVRFASLAPSTEPLIHTYALAAARVPTRRFVSIDSRPIQGLAAQSKYICYQNYNVAWILCTFMHPMHVEFTLVEFCFTKI